jgi:DNA (cytosine-5)-methyltransferase 1
MIFTVGSLFSGQEGIGYGLEQSGPFRIRWQAESREWCRKLLALRYPHSQIFKDARDVNAETAKRVHAIIGGFPCQDISNAGSRAGINRGTTIKPVVRVCPCY